MSKEKGRTDKPAGGAVIQFPEYKKLQEDMERLHTEISMLVLERDDLLLQHGCSQAYIG